MEIFYLNLARRTDRRERFLAVNSGFANFRRADAADGQTLSRDDLLRQGYFQEPWPDYSPGALGCAVSHKRMWDLCMASGTALTMAEDDAVLNRHFVKKASSVLAKLPAEWDIVLWGWNFDSVLQVELIPGLKDAVIHFDSTPLGDRLLDFQSRHYEVNPIRLSGAFGLVCYSVSPRGAEQLIKRCFPLQNESIPIPGLRRSVANFGIDVAMNKHYPSLQAYVCFPPLVWTENDKSNSDISPQ